MPSSARQSVEERGPQGCSQQPRLNNAFQTSWPGANASNNNTTVLNTLAASLSGLSSSQLSRLAASLSSSNSSHNLGALANLNNLSALGSLGGVPSALGLGSNGLTGLSNGPFTSGLSGMGMQGPFTGMGAGAGAGAGLNLGLEASALRSMQAQQAARGGKASLKRTNSGDVGRPSK